jgi:hypothetical protein
MTLTELQKALSKQDHAAVLVSLRVIERVIQAVCNLQGLNWSVPHSKSIVVDRHILFRFVEQDDLILGPDRLLPQTVILLAHPRSEDLTEKETPKTLLKYWQRLFHANVHLILEDRFQERLLTDAIIQERMDQIGQAEFEEIRSVLLSEKYLFEKASQKDIYIEFVAVFLELKFFVPHLLSVYFPAVRNFTLIEEIIAQDLDADALFQRTRLEKAPDPVLRPRDESDESHEFYWKLARNADRATEQGNIVKAAILRTRAARVAPAALTPTTRADAEGNLKQLTDRLKTALQLSDAEAAELFQYLKQLLDKADQGRHPVEAALLYDLQKICDDFEQEQFALDLVDSALSMGRKPVKRPLPSQKYVKIIRHLRSAVQRLTGARLKEDDRAQLSKLLQTALHRSEDRLRSRFKPVIEAVMEDVGLGPANALERIAFNKVVEELLDQINDVGFITFGDLRDAISRSRLKMPDLRDPQEFIRGDPLLRLDRRLSTLLDGVYRPSEVYMRWLQRLTSLNFGTRIGRAITRFFTIPFGLALFAIEIIPLMWKILLHVEERSLLVVDSVNALHVEEIEQVPGWAVLFWAGWLSLSLFFLSVLYVARVQEYCARCIKTIGKHLHRAFIDFPIWLVTLPGFRRFLTSWPVQLFYWYILKPGVVSAFIWIFFPVTFFNPWMAAGIFLGANLLLNSHTGMRLSESAVQSVIGLFHLIQSGLLAGIYHFIVYVFKQLTHMIDFLLLSVEEWLRFRKGDSEFSLFVRGLISILWAPIAFVTRFYFIVLIEPMVNPLKLPICFVAAKILYPIILLPQFTHELSDPLARVIGHWAAFGFVYTTSWLAPNFFGFLVWEIKENWNLYRSNRPRTLQPVIIGGHGETMRRYLQPGFHSGTIPKLFARLRHAERNAFRSENWRAVRSARQAIEEVKEEIRRFVDREMLSLLTKSSSWSDKFASVQIVDSELLATNGAKLDRADNTLDVGNVRLASNRVEIEIIHSAFPDSSVWIRIESRNNWLVANLEDQGWLKHLPKEQVWTFLSALACFYKYSGVDLVHEQIQASLGIGARQYEIVENGMRIWLNSKHTETVYYDCRSVNGQLIPLDGNGQPAPDWPTFEPEQLLFVRNKLSWNQLVTAWEEAKGIVPHLDIGESGYKLLGAGFPEEPVAIAVELAENGKPLVTKR